MTTNAPRHYSILFRYWVRAAVRSTAAVTALTLRNVLRRSMLDGMPIRDPDEIGYIRLFRARDPPKKRHALAIACLGLPLTLAR